MTDDPKPAKKPSAIATLYDFNAAYRLLNGLFPRSTVEILTRLTGVPTRSVTRWLDDQQRIPPTLLEKLKVQRELQKRFRADLNALLDRYRDEGTKNAVLRSEILKVANTEEILANEEI